MEFQYLYKAVLNAWQNIIDAWIWKIIVSFFVSMITSVHGSALAAFVVLVLVDLLTRWLALCSIHLKDTGRITEEINLFTCLVDIPTAIRAGYINSDAMKHRFIGKVIVYILLTIIAINVDILLSLGGEPPLILKGVWVYLAATEGLSILENLRDAGIKQADGLLDFFRNRFNDFFERLKAK
ncbi:MAG: Holin toxin secretion/phage lysis [Firmicutes bacterium]|nr:Holin toxin secretion/phage lysis [Bacillota bacterium]